METRTPKYCSVCGSRLIPSSHVDSYDPYTGDPVTDQRLYCNNPTILYRFGSRKVTRHPRWELTGGTWVQN